MHLSSLRPKKGARQQTKRLGRGESSGRGKTAGRGHKGQLSRSGKKLNPGFEGGQMPLFRRLPKFGFTNVFRKEVPIVNLTDLNRFAKGSTVDLATLKEAGLIKKKYSGPYKVLGKGELAHALTVKANAFSKQASERIQKAGGKVEVLS